MFCRTQYGTAREPRNDVSRLPTRPSHVRFWILARASLGGRQASAPQKPNRPGWGQFDHAAPNRSTVPLGSGRFSAEQRGRAVKQQCQSTAQGRFASVRSANTESSAATPSAARRRRSTGCTLHVSLKKNESIRPSRRPPPRPTHPHSKTRRRRDQKTHRPRR